MKALPGYRQACIRSVVFDCLWKCYYPKILC